MVDHKKLHALITLLDDPDKEVVDIVEDQILQSGDEFADPLEEVWLSGRYGEKLNKRIAEVLKKIQQNQLKDFDEVKLLPLSVKYKNII